MSDVKAAILKFNAKVEAMVELDFKARCLALTNDTIRNTPVDTGRLRSNWQATLNYPAPTALFTDEGDDKATINETGNARAFAAVALLTPQDAFYLVNNLPYARPVEEGSENQRPRRMLARAIEKAASRP